MVSSCSSILFYVALSWPIVSNLSFERPATLSSSNPCACVTARDPSRMWTLTVVKHTWKSLKVSEIVGFPAMWFWLVILSDSYWFFPILTDWFLSCHVLPQWNMIKNAEIIRNTISSRGSRNLCLFPAAGVWGQCRKANPLRSLGQTKGWECPPRIAHLFRG